MSATVRAAGGWAFAAALWGAGCEPAPREATEARADATPADPAAQAAHAALFAAADDLDLAAFKARLNAESVALVDAAIAAGATLGRSPKTPPLSWDDVLEAHRAVTPLGRTRTPYRLAPTSGAAPARLDLTSSPLGDLARTLIESKRTPP